MLLGMAAAVVPLAIHLFSRGRSRPQPFSDLTFLHRVHQTRMRRIRLRQWLVLLLRTLLILLIAAAFARPAYRAEGSDWLGSGVPTAAVLLLDRSFSTTYRTAEGRLFEQLQARAVEVVDLFREEDRVTLIPFAGAPSVDSIPTRSKEELAEWVRELLPSEEGTDLRQALGSVGHYLETGTTANRELFLFTDLSRRNWYDAEVLADSLRVDQLYVLSTRTGPRPNVFAEELRVSSWMPSAGAKLKVYGSIINASDDPVSALSADLFIDGERVQRRQLDLPARGNVTLEFTVTPRRPGRLTGYLELEEDALTLDNRRYFALDVPADIEVLLLGVIPTDTYFARRALTAAATADQSLHVSTGLVSDLAPKALETVDVLFLCNLRHLDAEHTRLVHDFVFGGGGLVIFPGPLADLSYINRELLPPIMPAAIKQARMSRGQRLDSNGRFHPLFDGMLAEKEADQPLFTSWFEIAPQEGLMPLAHFTNGHIALASAVANRGRAVLVAVPLVDDWSDLAMRGLFAPVMHRLTRYLSQREDHRVGYLVGDSVPRFVQGVPVTSTVAAESPYGDRRLISPESIGGRIAWRIPVVDESGIWKLRVGDEIIDRFPVNLDARESQLQMVKRQRVLEVLGDRVQFIDADDDVRNIVLGNRFGRELWREFLLVALILLFLELWIARAPQANSAPPPPAPAQR